MTDAELAIRGCSLLNPDFSVTPDAVILIGQGRILEIRGTQAGGESHLAPMTLDGKGLLALPGLVDAHTHSAQQLLRGSVVDELPMIWARILVPFESALTPEDVYASARLFIAENIKAGITTFAESGGPHMQATAQAAVEMGIRACISPSTMDLGDFVPPAMKMNASEAVRATEQLYRDYHGAGNGRVQVWFGIRQLMTSSPDLLQAVSARARELKTGVHTHLAEHLDEVSFCLRTYKKRPAEVFDSFGLLGPDLLCAHSVRLAEREILLMRERGASPVHCPRSNLGSHGFSKTPLMLALGMSIGLGTDGASGTRLDLFEQMRLLKSAIQGRYGLEINDPLALPAIETLRMATAGGAKAVRLEGEIGTLEVGKKADVILVDIDQPHISPTANLPQTIVMAAGPSDVKHVIVDGRLVLKDREFVEIDEQAIRREAAAALQRVSQRAGLPLPAPYLGG